MSKINYIMLGLLLFMTACTSKSPSAEASLTDPLQDTAQLSDMVFLRKRVNFNTVSKDTLLQAKYPFVNTGKKELVIGEITPDCTCTGYFISKKRVRPGDSAYIILKYSTRDRFGDAKVYATVSANTPTRLYSLEILAKIQE